MRLNIIIHCARSIAVAISVLLIGGCNMFAADKNESVSRDIGALQQIVKISITARETKWEIFGTPEDKGGGAPGPTDYKTLVAEISPTDPTWISRLTDDVGKVWIAPESSRPWLSPYFQTLLRKPGADLSKMDRCKKYQVQLTKTGEFVDGFVCAHEGLLLIHVKLLGPSTRDRNPAAPPVFE